MGRQVAGRSWPAAKPHCLKSPSGSKRRCCRRGVRLWPGVSSLSSTASLQLGQGGRLPRGFSPTGIGAGVAKRQFAARRIDQHMLHLARQFRALLEKIASITKKGLYTLNPQALASLLQQG